MNAFNEFLKWESSSRDTIDFKRAYADVAGDVLAGLVLSEIVYWHLPTRNGKSKLRITRDDQQWIACPRDEWWERVRLTPRQVDSALGKLVDAGIVIKAVYKFGRNPTTHVRIDEAVFLERLTVVVTVDRNRYYKSVKSPIRDNQEITDPLKPRKSRKAQEPKPTTTISEITNPEIDKGASVDARIVAIIDAWKKATRSMRGNPFANKTYRGYAETMDAEGITAEDVTRFIEAQTEPGAYWYGKAVPFGNVADNIGAWLVANPDDNQEPAAAAPVEEAPFERLTPERRKELHAEYEAAMAQIAANRKAVLEKIAVNAPKNKAAS